MKNLLLIVSIINLIADISLIKENVRLRRRLAEQTDKHWECNMQIALYSDEVNRLKARES